MQVLPVLWVFTRSSNTLLPPNAWSVCGHGTRVHKNEIPHEVFDDLRRSSLSFECLQELQTPCSPRGLQCSRSWNPCSEEMKFFMKSFTIYMSSLSSECLMFIRTSNNPFLHGVWSSNGASAHVWTMEEWSIEQWAWNNFKIRRLRCNGKDPSSWSAMFGQ